MAEEPKGDEGADKKTELKLEGHVSIVALIVAALITAVLAFLLGLAKRKAALERNKALVAEEALEELKEQQKLSEHEETREQAEATIKKLEAEVKVSKDRIEELDKEHQAYVKKLREVNSWDELFKD